MDVGLLWYDDDPQRTLEAKINRAACHYQAKYGRLPNTCYVHPRAVADRPAEELRVVCQVPAPDHDPRRRGDGPALRAGAGTVRVVAAPYVVRHHFWLGEAAADDRPGNGRAAGHH